MKGVVGSLVVSLAPPGEGNKSKVVVFVTTNISPRTSYMSHESGRQTGIGTTRFGIAEGGQGQSRQQGHVDSAVPLPLCLYFVSFFAFGRISVLG